MSTQCREANTAPHAGCGGVRRQRALEELYPDQVREAVEQALMGAGTLSARWRRPWRPG